MLERNSKLINKKFIQYLIPSILTIFALQFTSLLDGIIVGNMIGSEALSASSMVVPVLYIIQIPGLALGVGGAIVVGSLLGKRDIKKANKAFSACFTIGIGISLIIALLGPFISRPLASLFAEDLREGIYAYFLVFFLTDPIIVFSLLITSFMNIDNNQRLSSCFFIVANISKILLMILFIKVFNFGMYGAASSTAAGLLIASITLIFYFKSDKRLLKLTFKIKGSFSDFKESLKASSATALNYFLTAIQMIIINIVISNVITNIVDLSIYGLICNIIFVFDLIAGGILALLPTLCGIFNGEKDYYSLKSIVKKIYLLNLISAIIIALIIFALPNIYSQIFGFDNPEFQERANFLIRLYVFTFIPYELNIFSMNYYPSIEKNIPSYVTVLLRELILMLPITISLTYMKGLEGYAIAHLATECLTVLITYIFVLIYGKTKNYGKGLFMIPKFDFSAYDISIDNNMDNASIVSSEIVKFALDNKIDNRDAQMIGLASEEIVSNVIEYGYKNKKQNFIDINLKIIDNHMILRIRDDGMPFDPTKYENDNDEAYKTIGIKMVLALVDKMTYMRVLSLNNTVMEIGKKEGE